MEPLKLSGRYSRRRPLRIFCLGAHCDDIEIGCGATLLRLTAEMPCAIVAAVFVSTPVREAEFRSSVQAFARRALDLKLFVHSLPDGRLPAAWGEAKAAMERLKTLPSPDLILTHQLEDRHQDHRVVAELTWNTFRDNLIFEYEVPKYEGSALLPNLYVPVADRDARAKLRLLMKHYPSQRKRDWFNPDTFRSLLVLRGLESRSASGLAEGFIMRKGSL